MKLLRTHMIRSLLLVFCIISWCACASQRHFTDVNHIVHMGQSLGGGEQSLPIITTAPTGFGNLKFKTGTSTWTYNYFPDQPEKRAPANFEWVPLTAQARGAEGETIANGLCDHLARSLKRTSDSNARFLFSYAGQGGRYLRELNKRHDDAKDPRAGDRRSKGGHYATSIDDVKRAKSIADSLRLSYSVTAVTWMQGERGNDAHVNRWDSLMSRPAFLQQYRQDLIDLKNDYQQDIVRITHQSRKPPFFTYQTIGAMSGTAQWMACQQEKDMFLVSPTYMLPSALNGFYYHQNKLVRGAAIHLAADGERWLGEQFGKVIRQALTGKKKWQPLHPLRCWYDAKQATIYVQFHVPAPPLVIDSSFLPLQGTGAGLEVYDQQRRTYRVKAVSVTGKDIIQLKLQDPLPAGTVGMLRYALNNQVGAWAATVKEVNNASQTAGNEIAMVINGNITRLCRELLREGAFYCYQPLPDGKINRLIVRKVTLDENGDTQLHGETENLVKDSYFQSGRSCFIARIYPYGNIHDSDNTPAVFTFSDTSYGTRAGQPYPLFNWCIVFQDFPVAQE